MLQLYIDSFRQKFQIGLADDDDDDNDDGENNNMFL